MNAGTLRHQIELQSFTSTPNGMGGFSQTWSTAATVRAAIWPTSATEQKRAAAPTMVGTHTIRIRYYSGLLASWRIKFGTRFFSIVSIIDKDEEHVQVDLLCREVLG
jgi:SPP1 family predicted phage head-tail adaptor